MPQSNITPQVVHWAAQECSWQRSGELSVEWMIKGWQYAMRRRNRMPRYDDVLMLGAAVEPARNHEGFRRVAVRVGWSVKMDWMMVDDSISNLVDKADSDFTEADVIEWFRQYEEIHPFVDGNGRTGNILYNWLRGSLPEPVFPPNLWADPQREDDYEGPPVPSEVTDVMRAYARLGGEL